MVLHRVVFHAKVGKADNVVAAFKEGIESLPEEQIAALRPRILTDLSGRFDTVVVETTHENLAAYDQFRVALRARMDASEEPSATVGMVDSGRNEFYTIEYS